jgi:group II intron reverse transcriptase/maturase
MKKKTRLILEGKIKDVNTSLISQSIEQKKDKESDKIKELETNKNKENTNKEKDETISSENTVFIPNAVATEKKMQKIIIEAAIGTQTDHRGIGYLVPTKKFYKIADEIWNNYFRTDKILKGIEKKSMTIPRTTFNDLYPLMTREDFVYQALTNIRANKGSSTAGIDYKTFESISSETILNIVDKLKKGIYKFNPIKRIMIPKPGKTELRPLGLPTFEDRIVQEMIRAILESIYEPIFKLEHNDVNFGFRPKKSTHDAIRKIHQKAQNTEWCIEGDIKKAYDTVNHKILINILRYKIKDEKFLNLIKNALESGLVFKGVYEHTLLGTPQGGIVSPILFNIYMSELDRYILNEIQYFIDEKNRIEQRELDPITIPWSKLTSTIKSTKKSLQRIRAKQTPSLSEWPIEIKERYFNLVQLLRSALKSRISIPYQDKKRTKIRFVYVRYADDWVFFTNADYKTTLNIKEKINKFLEEVLKLTLSIEKTKITNVKKQTMNFLGFRLGYYASNRKILRLGKKRLPYTNIWKKRIFPPDRVRAKIPKPFARRTTGNQLLIGIDQIRLENRLKTKRFMANKSKGIKFSRRKTEWTNLTDYEIILRYNQVIRGLTNYYAPLIRDFSTLVKYTYIFQYSCLHTLASKHNTSITKIIKKYGNPPSAKEKISKNDEKKTTQKEIKLMDYNACKKAAIQLVKNKINQNDTDFLTIRINWRTTYKLQKYCVVCGSTNKIEMHHIRHIRKTGVTVTGFDQVLVNLNRKQIPVCSTCHVKIHKGLYNGTGLNDFYDPGLGAL